MECCCDKGVSLFPFVICFRGDEKGGNYNMEIGGGNWGGGKYIVFPFGIHLI